MLVVAASWIYVIFTTFILGYVFHFLFTKVSFLMKTGRRGSKNKDKKIPYEIKSKLNYVVTGLVIVNIYAQVFSIFYKVALYANIVLLALSISLYIYAFSRLNLKDKIFAYAKEKLSAMRFVLCVILFFVFAYFTSHGIEHYDTGLYHAQAIRLIEEVGVVKGVANFNQRLAYNSASFALSAIYSFSYLGFQSLHTMAGFFALILAFKCADIIRIFGKRKFNLSDGARLAAIYYLFTIMDEIMSPASDYFAMCMALYILISWLELDNKHERSIYPYAMISMLCVYDATLKLSTAPLILLSLKPIYKIVKEKSNDKFKKIGIFVLLAFAISMPFFIRNVIISGWLIYPVTFIDLFSFSWKVPKDVALYDAHEIAVYGRGYTDVSLYDIGYWKWFPDWFKSLSFVNKISLLLDILIVICAFIVISCKKIYISICSKSKKISKIKTKNITTISGYKGIKNFAFVQTILYISLLYWLLSSPLIRYGFVYLLMPLSMWMGYFLIKIIYPINTIAGSIDEKEVNGKVSSFSSEYVYKKYDISSRMESILKSVIIIFLIYKIFMVFRYDLNTFDYANLIYQKDYETFEMESYELSGVTLYYPVTGDRTGYDKFPASPTKTNARLIGSSFEEGFLPVK